MPLPSNLSSRHEALAEMLIQPTPRRVPPDIQRAANRYAPARVFALIGFVFGFFGAFFVWLFFPWNIYRDWQLRDAPTVPGKILSVDRTTLRVNKVSVFSYDFDFVPPTGGRTRGTSFTTGRQWEQGASVSVRYLSDNPAVCCLTGARSSEAPASTALVLLLPACAIVMIGVGIRSRRRLQFLLEYGQVTKARIISVEETSVRINQQRVSRILLQRLDLGAGGPITVRKYEPAQVALVRERLASGQPVIVLYDPSHPERMLLPEALA